MIFQGVSKGAHYGHGFVREFVEIFDCHEGIFAMGDRIPPFQKNQINEGSFVGKGLRGYRANRTDVGKDVEA
jgi:hypothetical protein